MRICIFCMQEVRGHVCPRCNEYKGIEEAKPCPRCGEINPQSAHKCESCGKALRAPNEVGFPSFPSFPRS